MRTRNQKLFRSLFVLTLTLIVLSLSIGSTAQPNEQEAATPESPLPPESISLDAFTRSTLPEKPRVPSLSSDLNQVLDA